ncbi:MAG: hypothetical protein FWE39_07520 [Nocardiaceae bacterium]|nr:hypothetical protein [Nocardiaceae bacterium]
MGAILGVGLSDNPVIARQDELWTYSLRQALINDSTPESIKSPETWPAEMRVPWESDHGTALARSVRESQEREFRRVRKAIDEFEPDAVIVIAKDHREALDRSLMVPYWFSAGDRVSMHPWRTLADTPSVFGDPADTGFELPGAPELSYDLLEGLAGEGFDAPYRFGDCVSAPHALASALVHLDWDDRAFSTPTIMLGVSPFGPRDRNVVGLSPLAHAAPLPPRRAFDLGAAIARVVLRGTSRVVIAAAAGWSHANNTAASRHWLWPDVDADEKLYASWREGDLRCVADLDPAQLEEHGWWEHSIWAVLAGAMTESGSELTYSSLQTNYLFNSNWVTSIFDPVDSHPTV